MARITEYEFGRIVVDGRRHDRDLILLPGRILDNWWRKQGHSLVIEDLEDVLEELPDHLIVGCGAHGRLQPDRSALESLRDRGIDVDLASTAEAVEKYNASDPRRTAAALHLTC